MTRLHYTPTYQSWRAMKQRCTNPNHVHYSNYGGRGIQVCARWNTYTNFLNDMGERPSGTTLDRKDNALDYSPGNCQWASRVQQNRNNAQNRIIAYVGEERCLSEWCELLSLNYARVYARLFRLNWSVDRAFQ